MATPWPCPAGSNALKQSTRANKREHKPSQNTDGRPNKRRGGGRNYQIKQKSISVSHYPLCAVLLARLHAISWLGVQERSACMFVPIRCQRCSRSVVPGASLRHATVVVAVSNFWGRALVGCAGPTSKHPLPKAYSIDPTGPQDVRKSQIAGGHGKKTSHPAMASPDECN